MRVPLWLKVSALFAIALGAGADNPPQSPRWRGNWNFLDGTAEITQTTGSFFRAAIAGDFNRDGKDDVLVAQAVSAAGVDGTPTPGILYMNEGGRFVNRTSSFLTQVGAPAVRWWAVVADFAGPAGPPDGWPDLFVPGGQSEPSRFFLNQGNDGSGNWLGFVNDQTRLVNSPITTATHSYNSRAADLNGDGLMDLVVFQYKPNLGPTFGQTRVLINSNGLLVDETATRMPARNEPSIFGQARDLNGDGYPDIALVNLKNGLVPGNYTSVPSVRVMLNDGTGRFIGTDQVMPERINPSSGLGTYSLEVGDFNVDGRNDLYIINWGAAGDEERDGVLLNLGSGNTLFTTIAYPTINPALDSDGDHPVATDLDGDGRLDVVTAQFSAKPYFLMNRSRAGVMSLVEATPPEVPGGVIGFRNASLDANGDGVPDVWLALRDKNYLIYGNLPEREPNGTLAGADAVDNFPALRTGVLHIDDDDLYRLPAGVSGGARIRLKPTGGGDLRLRVLDASGNVLQTSESAGTNGAEQIDVPAASGATFARVERQGATAGGLYRLEVLRPGTPLTGAPAERFDTPPSRVPQTRSAGATAARR
jgi:hypothetical protein